MVLPSPVSVCFSTRFVRPWLHLLPPPVAPSVAPSVPPFGTGAALDLNMRPDPEEDGPSPPVAEVLRVMLGTRLAANLVGLTFGAGCA